MTLIEAAKRVQAAWRDPQGMPEWCKEMDALGQAIAEAEQQEPVAYIHRQGSYWEVSTRPLLDDEKARGWTEEPLYKSPPKREWQGLTRAERFEIEKAMSKYYDYQHECKTVCLPEFANAIEAKLKEKNT